MKSSTKGITRLALSLSIMLTASSTALAAPTVQLVIRDHLFHPSRVEIPAYTKVRLMIINQDDSAEEFESYELNREKIIVGNSKTVVFIGPLPPGEYPFFGEFNMDTAQGVVVVK